VSPLPGGADLLAGLEDTAAVYRAIADAAAAEAGTAPESARRVALAATLVDGAMTAHGRAPGLSAEEILVADLRLAGAAEAAASLREPALELALAQAVMTLARGIAAEENGLGLAPAEILGPVVASGARLASERL
jgi:hypothetical protein